MTLLSAKIQSRLSELNRAQAGKPREEVLASQPQAGSASEFSHQAPPRVLRDQVEEETASTRSLPPGREVRTASGLFWRIDSPLDRLWRGGEQHARRGAGFLRASVLTQEKPNPELRALAMGFPSRVLFLDLETCGFAGSMIFLIGLLHYENGSLHLSQLLARDYAEEKAILHQLWEIAAGATTLCTFNGKSFDWPCVHDRSTLHHLGRDERFNRRTSGESSPDGEISKPRSKSTISIEQPWCASATRPQLDHCDLLHHARRKWKRSLPNCKLQTLERYICGRRRMDDIPGSDIPAAYHQFVRSGDAWELRSILHHNALDLVTLLQLALRISE